jgi:hypothetical protein
MDVHKDSIDIAVAEEAGEVRHHGRIGGDTPALSRAVRKLESQGRPLMFVYEAGPCGFGIYRMLKARGHECWVVSPAKRGDRYLRMLLTHGARSVLRAASAATRAGRSVDPLRAWALAVQSRSNHNKATCALASKLARICYACLRDGAPYGEVRRLDKKIARSAFPMAA